eukprot:Phypoly_transcript_01234.p1 GENE.Phypoly_transcript_01234~~Phypoly_transcript_01234.p1  ORF type:complete len:919 (+),score=249.66 Phypoly_transcript_01234:391-2757(+)
MTLQEYHKAILRETENGKSFALIGGPKTGKSRLLARCAHRVASAHPHKKVLYLCADEEVKKSVTDFYNISMKNSESSENLQVHTYASMCALFSAERLAERKAVDKKIRAARVKDKKELEKQKQPALTIINDHEFGEWVLRNCEMPSDSTHLMYRRAKAAAVLEYCIENPTDKQILSMVVKKFLNPYEELDANERKTFNEFEAKLATSHTYRENGQTLLAALQKCNFENLKFDAVFVDDFQALGEHQVKFLAHLLAEKHQLTVAGDDDVGENLHNFILYSKAFGLKDLQFYPMLSNFATHVHIYSHARLLISQTPNRLELFGFPKRIDANTFTTHVFFTACAHELAQLARRAPEERRDWKLDVEEETRKMTNDNPSDKTMSRAQHLRAKNEEEEVDLVLRVVNMLHKAPREVKPTICIVPHDETSATNIHNHLLGKVNITKLGLNAITPEPVANLCKAMFTYLRSIVDSTNQTMKQFSLIATTLYGFTPEESTQFFKNQKANTKTTNEISKVEDYQNEKKRISEAINRKKAAAAMLQFLITDVNFIDRLQNSQPAKDYPESFTLMLTKMDNLITNLKKNPPASSNKLQQLDEMEALYNLMSNEETLEEEEKGEEEGKEDEKGEEKEEKEEGKEEEKEDDEATEREGKATARKTKKRAKDTKEKEGEKQRRKKAEKEERGEEGEAKERKEAKGDKEPRVVIAHIDQIRNRKFDVVLYTGVVRTPDMESHSLLKSVYKAMTRASELFVYVTKQSEPEETYIGNLIKFTYFPTHMSHPFAYKKNVFFCLGFD